jgi:hypothetical protein
VLDPKSLELSSDMGRNVSDDQRAAAGEKLRVDAHENRETSDVHVARAAKRELDTGDSSKGRCTQLLCETQRV